MKSIEIFLELSLYWWINNKVEIAKTFGMSESCLCSYLMVESFLRSIMERCTQARYTVLESPCITVLSLRSSDPTCGRTPLAARVLATTWPARSIPKCAISLLLTVRSLPLQPRPQTEVQFAHKHQ